MEVLYPRCSGIDVHKRFVVACLSIIQHGQRHKELRQASTMTSDILALKAWLKAAGCTPYRDGIHRGLLETHFSLARRLLRDCAGQCPAHESRAWAKNGCERRRVDC